MPSPQKIYIAVIDDDESVSRARSRRLRDARLQPVVYPSAEAFLADTRRPAFECLVPDVQLPGMSGLGLSHRLAAFRKTDAGAPLLAALRRICGLDAAVSDTVREGVGALAAPLPRQ